MRYRTHVTATLLRAHGASLSSSMCHAVASADAAVALTNAPGLAAQHREVVQKRPSDDRQGTMPNPARQLTVSAIDGLAGYYADH